MLDIRCLASGSRGNSYAIDDGDTVLLLEAGVSAKKIQQGYIDLLPRVQGCLITHEHQDHAAGAATLSSLGIDLYASPGTFAGIGGLQAPYRAHDITSNQQITLGSWIIKAFETEHDAAEPLGFLLYSRKAKEKVLFATDTYYIKYQFKGLTGLIIECNYSLPVMLHNYREGRLSDTLKNRLLKSHMSLENLCDFLKQTDLSKVHDIYLIHLSAGNGSKDFIQTVQAQTGIPTTVLEGGG